jgi:hypothetical protein
MRSLLLPFALLGLSACAAGPVVHQATMPLELLRAQGQPPRMGETVMRAGSNAEDSLFSLGVYFDDDGATLGALRSVGWTVKLGTYCRDRDSWVQSVLIGPAGQVWRGFRTDVPAGPDRAQDWSSGSSQARGRGAVATPGLVEAMTAGGRFTLALEDDTGQRWNTATIDILTPDQRTQLFSANQVAFAAIDPAGVPVRSGMLVVVQPEPVSLPSPPRSCPSST